jgi:hypothetical protein
VEWNELIHYHLIPQKQIISISMMNMVIPPESWNELMTHHLIWNEAVPQAKTSLKLSLSLSLQICKYWASNCPQEPFLLTLQNSKDNGNPVRVIRGHIEKNSYSGKIYTYDGLYKVSSPK